MVIRLKTLSMTDFGPVQGTRVLDFPAVGAMGITGPNGSGKTHVTAALKFLLCGELDKQLCMYVHGYGKKDARKAQLEGVFDVNGQEMLLKRDISLSEKLTPEEIDARFLKGEIIKTKSGASLKLGDNKAIRAASVVNSTLEEITGIVGGVQRDAIFVDQGRAGSIMRATVAEVEKSLQSLSGAAVCQKAVNAAQALLAKISVVDRSGDLADKKGQRQTVAVELEGILKEIDKLKATRDAAMGEERAKQIVYRAEDWSRRTARTADLKRDLEPAEAKLKTTITATTTLGMEIDRLTPVVTNPAWMADVEAARTELASLEAHLRLAQQEAELSKTLNTLEIGRAHV